MKRLRRQEHQLIARTPLSLAALTHHDVAPDEADWFARCRADFIRSFPTILLDVARYAILLGLALMPDRTGGALAFPLAAMAAALIGTVLHLAIIHGEAAPTTDERTALARRRSFLVARAIVWSAMLAWALATFDAATRPALIGLAVTMMVVDGISNTTLPRTALGVALLQGACALVGLGWGSGWDVAGRILPVMLVAATFLHWSIFNLYYMFATRRIRTRRLSQSHETIRLVLNQYDDEGSDWLYEIDSRGCIVNPSPRFCAAAGFTVDVLHGLPLTTLLRDGQGAAELAERLQGSEPFRALMVSVPASDEERWWSVSGRPILDGAGAQVGWRGFIADQTDARRAEAQVAWLAHYDALTGLCNRALLQASLERLLSRCRDGREIALLYIDLDHFKEINDGLGHEVGDAVLVEVARRLEAVVRPLDLIARLGGDEFVIVAQDVDALGAQKMADRILEAVDAPILFADHTCHVGASIGLAFAPHDAATVVDLLRAGDVAMYNAKAGGRQRAVVFNPEMEVELRERRTLEIELRAAIRQGQLVLHYQPLLDVASGATTGYEALLRWNHPMRGLVPPADFIPVAEETGLIVEIGQWVIREALREAAGWDDHISVAVNLSPVQMRDAALLPTIVGALASSHVAPHRLELEITETTLLQDSTDVMELLHRLRALGVRIALDDFGTGYSSLNYLRAFPFDKIKIDRCFISDLATREDCQAIVRSVLALASELNMVTTAEGVEALDQLETLRSSGCDQVQGFLFSNAVPPTQITMDRAAEAPAPRKATGSRRGTAKRG